MILPLSLLGIFLSVILLYFNARNYKSSIYLSIFFLTISIYGLIQYAVLYSKSVFLVSIVFINIGFLSYLIGPMFYWYIRSVLSDDPSLKKNDILHLLPMLIFFAFSLTQIFSPWSHKVEIATRIVENGNYIVEYNSTVFYNIPSFIIFLSRPVLLLSYAVWSLILFHRYFKAKRNSSVLSQQFYMTKWLLVLFACLFILIFSHILLIITASRLENIMLFYTLNVLQFFSGVGMTGMLISPFFFPGVLYGLPRFPLITETLNPEVDDADMYPSIEKTNAARFESDYLLIIQQKTESGMIEFQPYLESDCNLASFSKIIKIPSHHLAYYFKEVKKQSFNDFRNELRVNHAKKLIMEGKAAGLTLEAIGLLSGFASRNTFFTAFKKIEGVTPGSFASRYSQEII